MSRPICIIDDDEDVRGVMCFALEFEGIKALPFASGLEAEEYLQKAPLENLPGLIIVDYMMPDQNGIEFIIRLFKEYPDTLAKIPIALSTARFADETADLPKGALRLEKPVDLNTFMGLAKKYSQAPLPFGTFLPL